jgi:hypothetical protein
VSDPGYRFLIMLICGDSYWRQHVAINRNVKNAFIKEHIAYAEVKR